MIGIMLPMNVELIRLKSFVSGRCGRVLADRWTWHPEVSGADIRLLVLCGAIFMSKSAQSTKCALTRGRCGGST